MVYIVAKGQIEGRILLVKAESREEVLEKLRLSEGECVVGSLTRGNISSLDSGSFVVITA